jgi:PAS domain S-box-containing protein
MSEHDLPGPVQSAGPSILDASADSLAAADQRLFATLFDVSPFPAVVSRVKDHTVIAINRRTSDIFGVSQADAAGLRVTDYYVDPDERLRLADQLTRSGHVDGMRLQIRKQDGEPFWALFSARLVTYEGETAILTVFTDISEQVSAEADLRASEQRLVAQSNALTSLTARFADANEAFDERLRHILSVGAETLQVERLSMWRFGDGNQTIRCVGMHHRSTGRHDCGALLYRRECPAYFDAVETDRVIAAHDAHHDPRTREFSDGYLTVHGIGAMLDVPLRRDNTTVGVVCAEHVGGRRDWTVDEQNFVVSAANLIVRAVADEERRIALARLAESDQRANLVVDTAHDAFVGVDSSGRITTWNAQAERTFGWTRQEALGRNLTETIIPERFREAHLRGMKRFHETGAAPVINQRLELAALHRTGREFPIEITISSPMPIADGYFFGAFLRDISDRIERDTQLRLAKESAESATRAKSEFLANMSHELRTPLNGVLGYAQLLQRDRTLNLPQREALDAIAKCGAHLLELINDVLDLSKIEAGRVEIEASSTDLVQLTIDLRYVVADTARRKGLQLTMTIAPDVPRRVVLDGRHLRQVLLNLLGNAVKFTHEGEVRLQISRTDEGRLLFEVLDTGIGIEPEALTAIFEAFTQTRAGAAAGGSGLGLTISQHLIRSMGDQLRVESTPGKGSRFHFALPLVPGEPSTRAEPDLDAVAPPLDARLAAGQHLTGLVVDDSTVSRRILASLLESAGVQVITAAGGLEAVDLAQVHRPDVIFMDLRMSDIDGFEAVRRLRQEGATASIPVIAVTASAFGDTRQAARDAGCVDYLPKPVRAEALFASLQTHLGVRFVAGITPAAPAGVDVTVARDAGIARRLSEAVTIGSVTDLELLGQELMAGTPSQAALGARLARLVADFDFDGLRELSDALTGSVEAPHAGQ